MTKPAGDVLGTRVLVRPVVDPQMMRVETTVPAGMTIAGIIAQVLPLMPAEARLRLRVTLVTQDGAEVVEAAVWHLVRPRPGVRVVVRPVPGGSVLRSILMVVVTIAAISLGQMWGLALGQAIGISTAAATSLITVGASVLGMLAINALIPVAKQKDRAQEYGGYSISGWRNSANPDSPIPMVFGRMRVAPPYAAAPYAEIVGDIQYIRAVFLWGYGPVALTDLKIGDTSIDEYDDLEIEHRYGYATDDQLTLCAHQVIEEAFTVELTHPYERADDGSIPEGATWLDKPVIRYSATDSTAGSVIIGFPAGIIVMKKDGKAYSGTVEIRIRIRPLGGTNWTELTTLAITACKSVPFWRQYSWTYPTRGTWEVELDRLTEEHTSTSISDRSVWQCLQSIRPEYPIAFDAPLALTAVRVKATYQLNGQLDNLSGIVSRIAPDWDAATETWITRETRSPAAAMRSILQGPASAYPVSDVGMDLDGLADWSEWCAAKGLHYDRVHEAEESLAEALSYAAAAGRAQPRHDGTKWCVVIDRPATLVVDHINPRNSRDFKWTRSYPRAPDGFRVKFADKTNDWKSSERLVPWPGKALADVVVTEQLELPGKCDPAEIWIEARRRQYEVIHRPDTFQVTQDGAARVATRGDLVAVSHDVLQRSQVAARVVRVSGALVVLDEPVEMVAGTDYAIRFRVFSADDTIGSSIVRRVATVAGVTAALRLIGTGTAPQADDLVHFGPAASESLLAFVRGEERGEDGAVIYHLVAAAPGIDTATDAEVPPAWDGRAGATYTGSSTTAPTAPRITSVFTGEGTGSPNGLSVQVAPGAGSVAVATYQIDHRLSGASAWTPITIAAGAGGTAITGYAAGNTVELRVRAATAGGLHGAYGPVVTVTIGAADVVVPDVTALSVTRLSSGLRSYAVTLGTSTATTVVGYRLRTRPGTGWAWADLSPLHTGYLTASPWEATAPLVAGTWTIGAVAVDDGGAESPHPLLISATLGDTAASGIVTQRIERLLGWPGTVTGGSVSGGDVVGAAGSPSTVVYRSPVVDLGSDRAITVAGNVYGVGGSAAIGMRTGLSSDGNPVGSDRALGSITARYLQIVVEVNNAAAIARLGDLAILVTSG